MKKQAKKMTLTRETLSQLEKNLGQVAGGITAVADCGSRACRRLTRAVSGATWSTDLLHLRRNLPAPTTADLESRSEEERREILRRSP